MSLQSTRDTIERLGVLGHKDFELVQIQHLRADTERFVKMMRTYGFKANCILGPDYSTDSDVVNRLEREGVHVASLPYREIEGALVEIVRDARTPYVLCEVGGYAAGIIHRTEIYAHCLGIVEETTHGLRRYEAVEARGMLPVPVVDIASSALKEMESRFVAEAVVRRIEDVLFSLQRALRDERVGVIGYGPIGRSVASFLRSSGTEVSCYDRNPILRLEAVLSGFLCPPRSDVLQKSTVLVGATGQGALDIGDIDSLREGAVLVSASSKDVEFPLSQLIPRVRQGRTLLAAFHSSSNRRLYVANDGYPVNFLGPSLPLEIADLVFAQAVAGIHLAASGSLANGLHRLPREFEEAIAEAWLSTYKS